MNKLPFYLTDSYKLGHAAQYPPGTQFVYSNFTARSNKLLNLPDWAKDGKYVVMGMQRLMYLINYDWVEPLQELEPEEFEDELKEFLSDMAAFAGPNGLDGSRFRQLYEYVEVYGKLPLEFKHVADGTVIDIRAPCLTVVNTDPRFYWLVNYMETYLSTEMWKCMTVATIARFYKRTLSRFATATGTPLEFVPWQAHDFSMRGMGGVEDGIAGGIGHLSYFTGSDNLASFRNIRGIYGFEKDGITAGSVPATEHSVMCMAGKDSEVDTFARLIKEYPSGILSIVSDTWDYFNVLTKTAVTLREAILARTPDAFGLAKIVFRPDSGNPIDIICGDDEAEPGSPEHLGSLQLLWNAFGGTVTSTGHRQLNERVGLIYGDSITPQRMHDILERMEAEGWASGNIVFGVGSYTYQYMTRDSLGFAMKATWGVLNGEEVFLAKDPKTDSGTKKSATGMLAVVDGKLVEGLTKAQEADIVGNQLKKAGTANRTLQEIRASLDNELVS